MSMQSNHHSETLPPAREPDDVDLMEMFETEAVASAKLLPMDRLESVIRELLDHRRRERFRQAKLNYLSEIATCRE